jgi:hypothetical protein
MVVGIHQPNFFPWLGYFDKIIKSDVFVLLDDVQFPKGSVANRNKVKNNQGQEVWLTVPMKKGPAELCYNEIQPEYSHNWNTKMVNMLKAAYVRTPHFKTVLPFVEGFVMKPYDTLAALNIDVIRAVCAELKIGTKLVVSSGMTGDFGQKNDRNLNICRHFGATQYLSGQGARKYNDEDSYRAAGIELKYQEYVHPEYAQPNGPFVSHLSVIDALFCLGFAGLSDLLHGAAVPQGA